ncbi:unnamed protein product [Nezara viridula]|uniref:Uncharacterized protein n=1 Tax=Nezara viridula TaxID=85310 RepID=A0A9P0H2K6_NEZVI|nr:unnamed protein product [Nezara viridula]
MNYDKSALVIGCHSIQALLLTYVELQTVVDLGFLKKPSGCALKRGGILVLSKSSNESEWMGSSVEGVQHRSHATAAMTLCRTVFVFRLGRCNS